MHPVVELEVADVEFGRADVVVQRVEIGFVQPVVLAEFGVESLERVEEAALVGVVQRLAEVQVPQVVGHDGSGRQRGRDDGPEQPIWRSYHPRHQLPSSTGARPESGPARVRPTSFGSTPLLNVNCPVWLKSAPPVRLAVDLHVDLVLAGRQVADVESLHAAAAQRVEFLEAVDVVRDELAVDLHPDRVDTRRILGRERDEHRHLRVGRVQQFFLEPAEFGGDLEDVGLDLLDLFVEALHLLTIGALGAARRVAEQEQQREQQHQAEHDRPDGRMPSRLRIEPCVPAAGDRPGAAPCSTRGLREIRSRPPMSHLVSLTAIERAWQAEQVRHWTGLDPAVPLSWGEEPVRPETLRRHLSMALPLTESPANYSGQVTSVW